MATQESDWETVAAAVRAAACAPGSGDSPGALIAAAGAVTAEGDPIPTAAAAGGVAAAGQGEPQRQRAVGGVATLLVEPGAASRAAQGLESVPGFGIHPWFAHAVAPGWDSRLRAVLARSPAAMVGEIGLDKAARAPSSGRCEYSTQCAVFATQLEIAHELGRAVSVHCVRAYGKVLETIRAVASAAGGYPRAVALHSYAGPVDMIGQFAGLGCPVFFGISLQAHARQPAKIDDIIRAVPLERLLLETDLASPCEIDRTLELIAARVAAIKGMEIERLARMTTANAARFIDVGS